jgi:ubiquinone/menaquinone biosynthesis C-methylase UbiE
VLTGPSVDITIPVLNEERTIVSSLTTLASYLETQSSYDWSITVADNGSEDRTFQRASSFATHNPRTTVLRLEEPGRGRALKRAWSASTADVVGYMDVDLSTSLGSLSRLIDPILEGRCEVSIGSRLAPGAEVSRGIRREAISRAYNIIARSFLHYGIFDAQCGFKAIRTSLARDLIPRIVDDEWFFDTELLALAHRAGMRINEVPVRWAEDTDTRVRIVKTAADDLKGIWRLWLDGRRVPVRPDEPTRIGAPEPLSVAVAAEDGRGADFDRYAKDYEEVVDRSVSFTGRNSAFYARRKVDILEEVVRPELGSLQGLSLLDVGCGTGTTDRFLAQRVRTLHGVDVSEEMLIQAKRNVPEAEFTWYDGEMLPFDDQTFDIVVAICVLHHVPPSMRSKVVSEMVRVSRPEGVVAVFEHNPYNPLTRHAVKECEIENDAVLLSARDTSEMLKESADTEPECRHYLFSPLGGAIGCSLDRHLRKIPFGGQYVAWVRRGSIDSPVAAIARHERI